MKKTTLLACFYFLLFYCAAQDATMEALQAARVNNMIFIRHGVDMKGRPVLVFAIDDRHPDKHNRSENINISVRKKDEQLMVKSEFQNPLVYTLTFDITTAADPGYESIGQALKAFSSLNTLLNSGQTEATAPATGGAPAPVVPGMTPGVPQMLTSLQSPQLATWLYNSRDDQDCIQNFETLVQLIYNADTSYYSPDHENDINSILLHSIENLKNAGSAADYKKRFSEFEALLTTLTTLLEKHAGHIKNLKNHNANILKATNPPPAGKNYCPHLVRYTRNTIDDFLQAASQIHENRRQLLDAASRIRDELVKFNDKLDSDNDLNSFTVARIPVDEKVIKTITLKYTSRSIEIKNNDIIIKEHTDKPVTGTIKMRTYRSFVAEISTGIFFTTLKYPKYGIAEQNGKNIVTSSGEDHYNYVTATHLNLIPNIFDGEVHPMIQVGVGTAKELPSLLGGIGIRFGGTAKLAVSWGVLYTWRKELNDLSINDEVTGTAQLEADLKYKLQNKPAFYIGLQYNF